MRPLILVLVLALTGCQNMPMGPGPSAAGKQYPPNPKPEVIKQVDWESCVDQTGQTNAVESSVAGAVIGGVVGAVIGSILCGHNCGRDLAILLGGTGAARMGARGAAEQQQEQQAMIACLEAKGYRRK